MKTPIVAATVLALATVSFETSASAQPIRFDPSLRQAAASPLLTEVQFRNGRGPGFRRHFGGGPRFGGGYRGGRGAAIGAGVAGLAAGALLGGVIASQAAPAYGYGYNGYGYGGYGGYDYGYAPPPPPPVAVYADGGSAGDNDAYCSRRFKSYDPGSGTYLGYDGLRHPCP